MKKIILFVLMIIASVNLFSNELPDELSFHFGKAIYLKNLVVEDIINNNFELKNGESYTSTFNDRKYGSVGYRIWITDNEEREITAIFNKGKVYRFDSFQKEVLPKLFVSVCEISIIEDRIVLYDRIYYAEDDHIIYEYYYDYTTYTYYNEYE